MRNNPCKNCVPPERHVGCHASCKKYKDAKESQDAEKALVRAAKRVNDDVVEVNLVSLRRSKHKLYARKW